MAVFVLVAGLLLVAYAALAVRLWQTRDFVDDGPLSFHRPAATPTDGLDAVSRRCAATGDFDADPKYTTKIVAATIGDRPYYACYQVKPDGAVWKATVVDEDGIRASDRVIKDNGAWRWIGTVKTATELVLGGCALAALLALYFAYYRRPRPGAPVPPRWYQTAPVQGVLGVVGLLPFTLPFRRRESGARRIRLLFQFGFGWATTIVLALLITGGGDRLSLATIGLLAAGIAFGWVGGRALLKPPGFGAPDRLYAAAEWGGYPGPGTPVLSPAAAFAPGLGPDAARRPVVAPAVQAGPRRAPSRVKRPGDLPTFADVGGMDLLKDELADTFGLLLAFSGEADTYRIAFNGVLLHGPPGVGKTFVARATAGEFGLNFLQVSTADLISKYVGESARNLRAVFAEAARNVPCLLFFDEFDSIAERRDDGVNEESKRVVAQLLQSLEEWRPVRELVIMAATNHLDRLDPAVVRAGRFDRHIRVDLPDLVARRAILTAQLAQRPVAPDVDLHDLARRTAGRTPATIARITEAAALAAFRTATGTGRPTPITTGHLRDALAGLGGTDRPTYEDWTWDRLVLDADTTAELRQVQALVTDPDLAAAYGVQMPSGLLLAGPPGTGKTTIARVFAAQAGCSFYPASASDLTSKWVGESEASVARLFARARDNAPSIVFLDEIDAIAAARSEGGGSSVLDRTLTQLLTEIDGITEQRGVFVMAATNRPDMLDPALLRGGRLSRTVTIPLPDRPGRRRLLALFSASMPLRDVDLDAVADRTDGFSGADLEALCQQAALRAMLRSDGAPVVTPAAFAEALAGRLRAKASTPEPTPDTGQYL